MIGYHKFVAPRVYGGASQPCERCGKYGSSPVHSAPEPTTVYVVTYKNGGFCGVWSDRDAASEYARRIGGYVESYPLWGEEEPS